ncbi:hypothetical protein YC2023_088644 [Brassica napus]
MANLRVFFSDPKSDRCSSVVEARLLRFWERREMKRPVIDSLMVVKDALGKNNTPPDLKTVSVNQVKVKNRVSQKTMNAHEAEAAAKQAVSQVEAAMTAAEEAAKEADAAEAAQAYA